MDSGCLDKRTGAGFPVGEVTENESLSLENGWGKNKRGRRGGHLVNLTPTPSSSCTNSPVCSCPATFQQTRSSCSCYLVILLSCYLVLFLFLWLLLVSSVLLLLLSTRVVHVILNYMRKVGHLTSSLRPSALFCSSSLRLCVVQSGCMYAWMDGWMDGWMDVCMPVCIMYVCMRACMADCMICYI